MDGSLASTVALQRVGAGLIVGALALFGLAAVVLPEIGALLVVALGLGVYAISVREERTPGLAAGLVGAALLFVLDRQLDPLGATVARSTAGTVVIGVGIVLAAAVVERYWTRDDGR